MLAIAHAGAIEDIFEPRKALEWLQRSAESGSPSDAYILGATYEYGKSEFNIELPDSKVVTLRFQTPDASNDDSKADWQAALDWYLTAAQGNDVDAQRRLALLYKVHTTTDTKDTALQANVTKDDNEALRWGLKAAESGDKDSQFLVATFYTEGVGILRDDKESVKWLARAANQGHGNAQRVLGERLTEGVGVTADYIEAYKWLNLAAANGYRYAAQVRDRLATRMSPDQVAEAQRRSATFSPTKENVDKTDSNNVTSIVVRKSATGFFVTQDGYCVTSAHVLKDSQNVLVVWRDQEFPATIAVADIANDIALLKVAGIFPALTLEPSSSVHAGETVITVGFPNTDVQGKTPKVTQGEINSASGIRDDPRFLQISVPIQSGNSGGALLNASGNVVGVITGKLDSIAVLAETGSISENVNYALKSDYVMPLLSSLESAADRPKSQHGGNGRMPFTDVARIATDATVLVLTD